MKKKILILSFLVFVIAGSLMGYRFYNREKPLVLSGSIEARDVELGSLLGGRVTAVHVREGDTVKTGQTLIELESDLIDLQILEQKSKVAEMKAQLSRTRKGPRTEELMRAKLEWENADRERKRLKELLDEGVIGRQAYDTARTKAETAQQWYREQQKGNRVEDIQSAEAALEREEGRLNYLMRQRKETVILSSVNGIVESLDLRPGDLLAANQPAIRILEPGQKWVKVYVPEPKLGAVRLGQQVRIKVDTNPRTFEGQITEINQQGEYTPRNVQTLDQRFDQVFGVKVRIPDEPELKPGMAAFVEL
jgi:HlyD family secretion protein